MAQHPWAEHVNPVLGSLFEVLKLNKQYVKGEGTLVFDEDGAEFYDFLAGYGSIPLGYHPKELWEVLHKVESSMEPTFIIPSYLNAAGDLAKMLTELLPFMSHVTFANSGSEALEWAIKLARMKTGKLGIVSARGGYHGKTLGALSATASANYQVGVGLPAVGFQAVSFGNLEELETVLKCENANIAAFIAEPIQGEGGIVLPPKGYFERVRKLCDEHHVLLILDEVQTGLGRTGEMFAFEHFGVQPDILCLAKALGGGMMPIGAMLSSPSCFCETFFLTHSSTFAGGSLACRVAIKTLEILSRDEFRLVKQGEETGDYLLERLKEITSGQEHLMYPRGKGLFIGLVFAGEKDVFSSWKEGSFRSILLGALADQGLLGVFISSFFLNQWAVRVATALNRRNVIRVEPALNVSKSQCDILVKASEDVMSILSRRDTVHLFAHLIGLERDSFEATTEPSEGPLNREGAEEHCSSGKEAVEWVFICSLKGNNEWAAFDQSISAANLSPSVMDDLNRRLGELMEPFVVQSFSKGAVVCIPRTNADLETMDAAQMAQEISETIAFAIHTGAKEVVLATFLWALLESAECVDGIQEAFSEAEAAIVGAGSHVKATACISEGAPLFASCPDIDVGLFAAPECQPWKQAHIKQCE